MMIARREKGYSRRKAAEKLGISYSSIGRWENGGSSVPYSEYCRIMALYDYDVVELKEFRESYEHLREQS